MLKFTKTSKEKELNGVEGKCPDGAGNFLTMTIARMTNNPHYDAAVVKVMEPYQGKKNAKKLSNTVATKLMNKVLAEEILLGWNEEELLDEDGKPVPYSSEAAEELLNQDGDVRDFVEDFSSTMENYLSVEEVSGK